MMTVTKSIITREMARLTFRNTHTNLEVNKCRRVLACLRMSRCKSCACPITPKKRRRHLTIATHFSVKSNVLIKLMIYLKWHPSKAMSLPHSFCSGTTLIQAMTRNDPVTIHINSTSQRSVNFRPVIKSRVNYVVDLAIT